MGSHRSDHTDSNDTGRRAAALLAAWERGLVESPGERALTLLRAGEREPVSRESLAAMTVGERDRRLLELRRELFGSTIDAVVMCTGCPGTIELRFDIDDVVVGRDDVAQPRALELESASGPIVVRVPTAGDVAVAYGDGDAKESLRILLDSIILSGAVPEELDAELLDRIGDAVSAADPQSEIALDAVCPACGTELSEPMDVAAFVWTEIGSWVSHLLGDVHVLARAYGWCEADVLALSPLRRRFYLEAVEA